MATYVNRRLGYTDASDDNTIYAISGNPNPVANGIDNGADAWRTRNDSE